MNIWSLWTWISVVVLILGSSAVFVWFLVDIVRIRREILDEERAAHARFRIPPDLTDS